MHGVGSRITQMGTNNCNFSPLNRNGSGDFLLRAVHTNFAQCFTKKVTYIDIDADDRYNKRVCSFEGIHLSVLTFENKFYEDTEVILWGEVR